MFIITCYNNRYVFVGRDPIGDPLWAAPDNLNHFSMIVFNERDQAEKALVSFSEAQRLEAEICSIITPLEG
ncbi:hypothetical protein [uncultured Halomonas sp.]|uniref:hypothetical protein n=1 Tax=uncultured Halomonas sp. TaxID=173971 RepID=UPI0026391AA3|nr:hypothetical protein [uncultured Halomonas sp.]